MKEREQEGVLSDEPRSGDSRAEQASRHQALETAGAERTPSEEEEEHKLVGDAEFEKVLRGPEPDGQGEALGLLLRMQAQAWLKGPLAWMARNAVAANLLMIVLLIAGFYIGLGVKQEVFPEFDLDRVTVGILYPGASPEEVEEGVILVVEEAVRGLDGVKEVRSVATEGSAQIMVELLLGVDSNKALTDIKNAVDRITSFPLDIERPVVSVASNRNQVISLVIYGDLEEKVLRQLAERARSGLLEDERITMAELAAVRPLEISVEVPQEKLRAYGLTLERIAQSIRQASVDLPGGGVKTRSGELLLRTTERRDWGSEFEQIVLLSRPDGSVLKVGDVAEVVDGFQETDSEALFNGKLASMVNVFRVGEQTPIEVAAAVKEYVAQMRADLPEGVSVAIWNDQSEMYRDRMSLLIRNGRLGLLLVLLVLGLFLEARLAFWVTMGIPISFVGSLLLMPMADVSINMISLFAFIVTLGIVVDDAIVVGESIYSHRNPGVSRLKAAILGVREVVTPVVFSVLTTIVAFVPMLFVPGVSGKFFRNIPWVVIAVLVLSLVESLLILPAHLAHGRAAGDRGVLAWINRRQQRFGQGLHRFIRERYKPSIDWAVKNRYITIALSFAVLLASVGLLAGGRIAFTFMPRIDSDVVVATVNMPFGSAIEDTREIGHRLSAAAGEVLEEAAGEGPSISRGVFAQIGASGAGFGSPHAQTATTGSHIAQVIVYLRPSDQRDIGSREFATRWRDRLGEVVGIETLTIKSSTGPGDGAPIDFELSHPDNEVLEAAAARLAALLENFSGTTEVDDGFARGKEQLDIKLRPEARSLGLQEVDLGRQLRSAFYGAEALRQQRGRDELRVYVRLPRHQRESEYNWSNFCCALQREEKFPWGRRGRAAGQGLHSDTSARWSTGGQCDVGNQGARQRQSNCGRGAKNISAHTSERCARFECRAGGATERSGGNDGSPWAKATCWPWSPFLVCWPSSFAAIGSL